MKRAGCVHRVRWHDQVNAPQYQRLTSIEAPYCPDVFKAARYGLGLREFHGCSNSIKGCMHFLELVARGQRSRLSNHRRRSPFNRPGWLTDCIDAKTVQLSCTSDRPQPLHSCHWRQIVPTATHAFGIASQPRRTATSTDQASAEENTPTTRPPATSAQAFVSPPVITRSPASSR